MRVLEPLYPDRPTVRLKGDGPGLTIHLMVWPFFLICAVLLLVLLVLVSPVLLWQWWQGRKQSDGWTQG